jgi:26S proteasome regulatory subunit N10
MVLDNSEYSRNGDYPPSRLDAQKDAATLLFNAKTQVHHVHRYR